MADTRQARHRFVRRWAIATAIGAAAVSACDALLLERSKGFFTGGFLSVDQLEGPGEAALFLAISLLVDAGVVGFLTAALALGLGSTRLHAPASLCAGVLAAAGSLIAADIVTYEIARYLGDTFDLALMFDLAGGSVGEIAAVTADHLLTPVALVAVGAVAGGGIVWVTHRSFAERPCARAGAGALAAPALLAGLAVAALVIAAGASDTLENGLLRKPAGRLLAFAANEITDVDRDGFGVVGRMSDPDPFDSAVFPYALEVPGNGVDENGVAGDLPAGAAGAFAVPAAGGEWRRRPDVVLVVLESFRADLVALRHNGVPVTPAIGALAARGASVTAYSHNGYTVQSRQHLFSGSLAAAGTTTLIDDFNAHGYLTAYFSAQDESFGGPAYDVGFSRAQVSYDARADRDRRYSTSTTPGSLAVPFTVLQERIYEFLRVRGEDERPLFLYVNYHDTHFPYWHQAIGTLTSSTRLPRERIAPESREALWATYVNTAANVDRAVGGLLEAVGRVRGRAPGVIVTADHGESLFDEGFLGHGYDLTDVQTRIPLVVANLPMDLAEPFAQAELRGAIWQALAEPPERPARPAVRAAPNRRVFQYLGDLARPRQIAFRQSGSRLTYDFRSGRVQIAEGAWRTPAELGAHAHSRFVELVQHWERLQRHRRLARRHGDGISRREW